MQTTLFESSVDLTVYNRIQAGRCGGIVATYTFMGWYGHWAVSASGIDDIAATHIRKVNGEPVTF